jgi:microcystin-dependent protein
MAIFGQIASSQQVPIEPFPVGALFIAVVNTNPATLLGYGTWAAIGAGRIPVGFDSGDTDFDTVEETGGAKTVTLTEAQMPVHTHTQNPHGHNISHVRSATTGGATTRIARSVDTSSTLGADTPTDDATAVNQNAGSGQAHNNMPPYFVVHMWKRTA